MKYKLPEGWTASEYAKGVYIFDDRGISVCSIFHIKPGRYRGRLSQARQLSYPFTSIEEAIPVLLARYRLGVTTKE